MGQTRLSNRTGHLNAATMVQRTGYLRGPRCPGRAIAAGAFRQCVRPEGHRGPFNAVDEDGNIWKADACNPEPFEPEGEAKCSRHGRFRAACGPSFPCTPSGSKGEPSSLLGKPDSTDVPLEPAGQPAGVSVNQPPSDGGVLGHGSAP